MLLGKPTLVPVLHDVSFSDVKQFSGFLGDLLGLSTAHDSIPEIAAKVAAAVRPDGTAATAV